MIGFKRESAKEIGEMNHRVIRATLACVVFVGIFAPCYMHFIPPDRIIPLNETNITSGENGEITSCNYDGLYDIDTNYTFRGGKYTTGEITKGFLRPLLIQKDREQHLFYIAPERVDSYFNDSRFLSFQFYVDQSGGNDCISFIKGVCNENEFYYDSSEDINYMKLGYEADCRLLPHEADITYHPDKANGVFWGMIVVGVLTVLYWIIDIRIFP